MTMCKTRLTCKRACFFRIYTVHSQRGRVGDVSSPVRRDARILARVSRRNGLDAQCAHMPIDPRDS